VWQNALGEVELRLYDMFAGSPPIFIPLTVQSERATDPPSRLISLQPRHNSVREFFRTISQRLLQFSISQRLKGYSVNPEELAPNSNPFRGTSTLSFQCVYFLAPSSSGSLNARFGTVDCLGSQERVLRWMLGSGPNAFLKEDLGRQIFLEAEQSGLISATSFASDQDRDAPEWRSALLSVALENNLTTLITNDFLMFLNSANNPMPPVQVDHIRAEVRKWAKNVFVLLCDILGTLDEDSSPSNESLYGTLFGRRQHSLIHNVKQIIKELQLISSRISDLALILEGLGRLELERYVEIPLHSSSLFSSPPFSLAGF
jgi:hypothetical protein